MDSDWQNSKSLDVYSLRESSFVEGLLWNSVGL